MRNQSFIYTAGYVFQVSIVFIRIIHFFKQSDLLLRFALHQLAQQYFLTFKSISFCKSYSRNFVFPFFFDQQKRVSQNQHWVRYMVIMEQVLELKPVSKLTPAANKSNIRKNSFLVYSTQYDIRAETLGVSVQFFS